MASLLLNLAFFLVAFSYGAVCGLLGGKWTRLCIADGCGYRPIGGE